MYFSRPKNFLSSTKSLPAEHKYGGRKANVIILLQNYSTLFLLKSNPDVKQHITDFLVICLRNSSCQIFSFLAGDNPS